jgi:RNA-splicing ligase RtcB
MIEITGKHNTAKVFTSSLDEKSQEQIKNLCDQPFVEGSTIRLMPDVHAGAGCTIGTTMTVGDKIVPNLVGVDIGCGMETVIISANNACAKRFDPNFLDSIIYDKIPAGTDIRNSEHEFAKTIPFRDILCPIIDLARARRSVGTLGGGNHFIEAARDDEDNLYIVVHSGSRHMGKEIAEYYQKQAWAQLNADSITDIPRDLAYVSGNLFEEYINDMTITQQFALVNRKAMMSVILQGLDIPESAVSEQFSTIHNYIDMDSMILRKGAVSAKLGEKLIIPINMRDGCLVCEGLGNPDWNFSAPHGAGRIMSRTKAFEVLQMEDYEKSMKGIYSTCINRKTLDESPMAYKDINEIIAHIEPTAKILKKIKPIYNFKSAEQFKRKRKNRK